MSCTEKFPGPGAVRGTFCSFQVWPLSWERQRPKGTLLGTAHVAMVPLEYTPMVVAAHSVVFVLLPAETGSMMIRATALPAKGPGLANGEPTPARSFHVWPPLTERRMPRP